MQDEESGQAKNPNVGRIQEEWEAERDAVRAKLLRQIESAFDGVELGGGVSLHQARAMDDYESPSEIAAARTLDTESRWQDISDEKLDRLSHTLAHMDAEGFRFHIPRFMTYALLNEGSGSFATFSPIYFTEKSRRSDTRTNLLSEDQRAAVEAFADFYSEGW